MLAYENHELRDFVGSHIWSHRKKSIVVIEGGNVPRDGYNAVRWMRRRSKAKRGGNAAPDDGLDRAPQTLTTRVEEYLEWLRIHNRTEAGVESKWRELKPFLGWASERGLSTPSEITRAMLESYQRWLWRYRKKNGQPLGSTTQRGRLGTVKLFFSWLCKQRVLEANPASELELPRVEKRLPIESLTRSEMETLLSMPDISDPLGIRDRAMIEVFYSTGIRRSELVRLELQNIKFEKRLLYIRQGKGMKDRVVPVGTRALQWLQKYLDDVRPLLVMTLDTQAMFLSGYGEAFNPQVLGRIIIRYIQQADIGRKGGPHLLRHTCATHMLEGGADIRYIQQLLGHEKLETTAIYTEVSIIQLQAVHARCHPAESGEAYERSRAERSEAPRPSGAAESGENQQENTSV